MNLRTAIAVIGEAIFGPRIDASLVYQARVETQRGSGNLDLRSDGKRIPADMSDVPIRYGIPGVSAKVRKDAIVFVQFIEGDRARPVVVGWDTAAVTELVVAADLVKIANGNVPVAYEGASVACFIGATEITAISKLMSTGGAGSVPIAGYILKGSQKTKTAI